MFNVLKFLTIITTVIGPTLWWVPSQFRVNVFDELTKVAVARVANSLQTCNVFHTNDPEVCAYDPDVQETIQTLNSGTYGYIGPLMLKKVGEDVQVIAPLSEDKDICQRARILLFSLEEGKITEVCR